MALNTLIWQEMHKKELAFGPLTHHGKQKQGREGGSILGEKIISPFLDELEHLEQFYLLFLVDWLELSSLFMD